MSKKGRPVIRVPKEKGQQKLEELKEKKKLDPTRSIREEEKELVIPVKRGGDGLATDMSKREKKRTPFQQIKDELGLKEEKKERLPDRWEKIGDVLFIKLPEDLYPKKEDIAKTYAEALDAKTVMLQGSIEGKMREPKVEKIYGEETETVHLENEVKYKLDTAELMFSSGNIDERVRMAETVQNEEVVVDMFAGIGYFSLPMAVHGDPKKIYSLEINPTSFRYLKENISLNGVEDTVIPWKGDNRDFNFTGADRIVMGYLHDTWKYLDKAVEFLEGSGIIHYHTRSLDSEYPEDVEKELAENLKEDHELLKMKKIKSYAPHIFHVVADIRINKGEKNTIYL